MTITRRLVLGGPHRRPRDRRRRPAGSRGDGLEDQPPIPRWHDRQRRFPRSAVPQIRRRVETRTKASQLPDLSELVADEDGGAVLGAAQRRARSQPLSARLCRREVQELNIGLMPGLTTSYAQVLLAQAEIGAAPHRLARQEGVQDHHLDLAGGGVASRAGKVVNPDDVKASSPRRQPRDGPHAEGGGRHHLERAVERDLCRHADRLARCRHHLVDQPHHFRLEEISKNLTTGRGKSFWYMLERC